MFNKYVKKKNAPTCRYYMKRGCIATHRNSVTGQNKFYLYYTSYMAFEMYKRFSFTICRSQINQLFHLSIEFELNTKQEIEQILFALYCLESYDSVQILQSIFQPRPDVQLT